jgi:LysM repeat protein
MAYTISKGDTLSSVAGTNNTTTQALMQSNPSITNPNLIYAGKSISLPQVSNTVGTGTQGLSINNPKVSAIPPVTLPQVNPQASIQATTSGDAYLATLQQQQQALAQPDPQQASMQAYNSMLGMYDQKAQYQQDLYQQQGISDTMGRVNDLTNQIRTNDMSTMAEKQRAMSQSFTGGSGGQTTFGQQTSFQRSDFDNNMKNLGLSAQLQAEQGNLGTARALVTDMVNMKFQPLEDKIKLLEKKFQMEGDILARKDKKAYEAQQNMLAYQKDKVASQKADEEAKQNIALTAGKFGANASITNAIINSKTVGEAIANATGHLTDPYEKQLKQAQLAKIYADIDETRKSNVLANGAVPTPTGLGDAKSTLQQQTANLKLTEGQAKALAFSQRAIDAEKNIQQMIDGGYDPTSVGASFGRGVDTSKARDYDTYIREYVTAVLRKDSGATITPDEIDTAKKMYDPASGSFMGWAPNSTVKTKQGVRGTAIDSIISEAGLASSALNTYRNQVTARGGDQGSEVYEVDGAQYVRGPDGNYYPK